jgi:pyruvate,orthophosphate dikinase
VTQFVYEFSEGTKEQRDLLGGKGANLAEMTRLGLPVPPGFTITTEACRSYLARCAASKTGWTGAWATVMTRSSSACGRARSSPCPA